MSGFSISLQRRHYCSASGRNYSTFPRRTAPNEHDIMNCPVCGKRVTLRVNAASGLVTVIPRHIELSVGF